MILIARKMQICRGGNMKKAKRNSNLNMLLKSLKKSFVMRQKKYMNNLMIWRWIMIDFLSLKINP